MASTDAAGSVETALARLDALRAAIREMEAEEVMQEPMQSGVRALRVRGIAIIEERLADIETVLTMLREPLYYEQRP